MIPLQEAIKLSDEQKQLRIERESIETMEVFVEIPGIKSLAPELKHLNDIAKDYLIGSALRREKQLDKKINKLYKKSKT